jgi:DNA polymerase-3 subunit epsilon
VIITGLDTETTGLHQDKGHRLIEVCMRFYRENGTLLKGFVQRYNPQRAIDPAAQAIHGIAIEDLAHEPVWDVAAASKVAALMKHSQLIVCHNAAFDIPFICGELQRVGVPIPEVHVFCTFENGHWATPLGKPPSLGELCFGCGIPYDTSQAHAAEYDVSVMMDCFFKGVRWGQFKLPEALQAKAA